MKKLFGSLLFLIFLGATSFALAGEYDGIWAIPDDPGQYVVIRHNGGTIFYIAIEAGPSGLGETEVFMGEISGNRASIRTLFSDIDLQGMVSFGSTEEGIVTVESCYPEDDCDYHPGDQFVIRKVF